MPHPQTMPAPAPAPAPWNQPIQEPVAPADPPSLRLLLARLAGMVPGMGNMMGGAMAPEGEDVALPTELGTDRDPRLGAGSLFDQIRRGKQQVDDLVKPGSLEALQQRRR